MIHFLVPKAGAFTMDEYFSVEPPSLVQRFHVVPYEDLPRQTRFGRGTYVLAGLDQLSPGMDRLVRMVYQRLHAVEGIRILNDPSRWMGRYDLLRALHAEGRNDFRAFRLNEDLGGLRYPVFLRGERCHDGNYSPLLHSSQELDKAVGLSLMEGRPHNDLLAVEFCSTDHPDGLYRKYAAFKVGDRILARSLNHAQRWMVKFADSQYTRDLVLEEQEYVRGNPHTAQLAEIFDLARIDYGQIDYSFKDGRIQIWEINLHATIGRTVGPAGAAVPPELRPLRSETREYFFDRFREAWAAVDQDSGNLPAVELQFDKEVLRAATHSSHQENRLLGKLRAALRPIKPLLEPVARRVLGLVGLLARKTSQRR